MLNELTQKAISSKNDLNAYFLNKQIPLDQRWSEFNSLPNNLKSVDVGMNLIIPHDVMQDMSLDKGSVLSFSTFVENLEYMIQDANAGGEDLSGPSKSWLKRLDIDDLIEKIMAKGFQSFVYTW